MAANLGWLFDGFETYALILTVGPAMRSLLNASQYPQIPVYIGTVIAITLLGWGIGGLVGGVLADYIGRKRMMIYAILAYSIMTGLTALSFDWLSFAILRFLVGVAIGSEWATGSSMMAELYRPCYARWGGIHCQTKPRHDIRRSSSTRRGSAGSIASFLAASHIDFAINICRKSLACLALHER